MNKRLMEDSTRSIQADRFILAKNWDRLGGRVHEILNGYLLSQLLGREFYFIWPDEKRFPEMNEQIKIFSEDFIQKHRIFEKQIAGFNQFVLPSSSGLSIDEFKSLISDVPERHYLRPSNFFKIPQFSGIDSHYLFKHFAEEVFSSEIRELNYKVSTALNEHAVSTVLHLRYGDLLTGSFRQYPDVSKYFPYCLAYKMLSQKKHFGKVIIISDSPEILKHLTELDSSYLTSKSLQISENIKDEFSNLIIDLLIMKNCSAVFAPSLSAFSQLGTHLGAKELEIVSVDNQVGDIHETLKLIEKDNIYQKLPKNIAGPLSARDIAQLMNAHSKFIDLRTWKKVASEAALLDPQYVVGCAQMAVVYSFSADYFNADKILEETRTFAYQAMDTHEDPIVYLTVVEVFCIAFQIVQLMNKGYSPEIELLFKKILSLMQILKSFKPFQIPLRTLIESLEFSLNIIESEILLLKSQKRYTWKIAALKQNAIIRSIFKLKTKYLPPEEIFTSIYCNLKEDNFLSMLVKTLQVLLNLTRVEQKISL